MKVRFHLPFDYPKFDPNVDYQKKVPVFDISATDDDGNPIPELSRRIPFGPEFYDFVTKKLPAMAGHYGVPIPIGDVGERPIINPEAVKHLPKYAYFGYGPLNSLLNTAGEPYYPGTVNLMDFSDKEYPTGPGQKYLYARPTVPKYTTDGKGAVFSDDSAGDLFGTNLTKAEAMERAADRVRDVAMKKSDRLTNILRESMDFSPLFGGTVPYRDEEDEKAISDVWIPIRDANGNPKLNKEGKPIWIPAPQIRELPIYNFNHPMWGQNPKAAWDMLKGYNDTALGVEGDNPILHWIRWGDTPVYANIKGEIERTSTGEPRKYEYAFENSKLADPQHHSKYMSTKDNIRDTLRKTGVPFTEEDVEALLDKGTYGKRDDKTVLRYYYPSVYDSYDMLSKLEGGPNAVDTLRHIWKLADFDRRNFDKNQAAQAKMLDDYQAGVDKEKSVDSMKKRVAQLRSETNKQYDLAQAKKDFGGVDIRSPSDIRKYGRDTLKQSKKKGSITPEQFDELDKYWFGTNEDGSQPTLFQERGIYKNPREKFVGEMLRQMEADKQKDTQSNIIAGLKDGAQIL